MKEGHKKFFEEHPHFTNKGSFQKGQLPHNKNKIWITDGKTNKYIQKDDLSEWQKQGWKKGCTQNRKKVIPKTKQVYCVELDKVFKSCEDASKFIGCTKGSVSEVARGVKNTVKGYHFKYL